MTDHATPLSAFGNPTYGITRNLGRGDFALARQRVVDALKPEGFGVLTEIDVRATLKAKLGIDVRPTVILGACNPPLALRAMQAELPVSLLLPCNVVVAQEENGDIVASAIDPRSMLTVTGRTDLEPFAAEVRDRLSRAIEAVPRLDA